MSASHHFRYAGLISLPSEPRPKVKTTRTLVMPDGTKLLCRQREDENGPQWTAEIPLDLAKELYAND